MEELIQLQRIDPEFDPEHVENRPVDSESEALRGSNNRVQI